MKTYWQPIAIDTMLKLGWPDFAKYYQYPTFIRVTKEGVMDKREIVAIGCEELPPNAEIILKDFEIAK